TGLAVVLGVVALAAGGGSGMLDTVAFVPFFGPHVAFAGGVAAAAYAARRGGFDGKDIVTPLASIRRPKQCMPANKAWGDHYCLQRWFLLVTKLDHHHPLWLLASMAPMSTSQTPSSLSPR